MLEFDDRCVDPADCVANAKRFDTAVFERALPREVERAMTAPANGERTAARVRRGRIALTRRPG